MAGRKLEKLFERKTGQLGDVFLEVKHLKSEKVNDVSFRVKKGEIYGLSGLMGAGRTEILRALFGIDKATGEILVDGKPVENRTPTDAIRNHFAMVTEDRLRQGAIYSLSILGNTTLSAFKSICNRLYFFSKKNERIAFAGVANGLSIKYGRDVYKRQIQVLFVSSAELFTGWEYVYRGLLRLIRPVHNPSEVIHVLVSHLNQFVGGRFASDTGAAVYQEDGVQIGQGGGGLGVYVLIGNVDGAGNVLGGVFVRAADIHDGNAAVVDHGFGLLGCDFVVDSLGICGCGYGLRLAGGAAGCAGGR